MSKVCFTSPKSSSTGSNSTGNSFGNKAILFTPLLKKNESRNHTENTRIPKRVSIAEENFYNSTDNYTDDERETNLFSKLNNSPKTPNQDEELDKKDNIKKNIKILLAFLIFNTLTYILTAMLPTPTPSSFSVDHPVLGKSIQTIVMLSTLYWYSYHLPLNITKIQTVTVDIIYLLTRKLKMLQLSYWSIAMIILTASAALSIESQLIYLLIPVLVVWLVDEYKRDDNDIFKTRVRTADKSIATKSNNKQKQGVTREDSAYDIFPRKFRASTKSGSPKLDIIYARLDEIYESIDKLSKKQIHFSQTMREVESARTTIPLLVADSNDLKYIVIKLEEKLNTCVQLYEEKTNNVVRKLESSYARHHPVSLKRKFARIILSDDQIDVIKLLISPKRLLIAVCSFILHQVVYDKRNLESRGGL